MKAGFARCQEGVALVVVLWMITLMAIMAGSFSLSTQRNTGLVKTSQDRARGLALAEAGVNYAMIMLTLPDPLKRWRSDGSLYRVGLPDGEVAVSIYDETGKIDINAASEQTLRVLFGKLTGNEELAASLADRIMDWRDPDDVKRLHGAEAKDYLAEGKAYVPQNKNFQVLEELQMVLGITPALYKKLEPVLTIYSGQDGVNPQKAPGEVLRLLFGLDDKTLADYLSQRATAAPNVLTQPPVLATPGSIRMVSGGDIAYTIVAEAKTETGHGAGLTAIARRQISRNTGAPFVVLGWKQQIAPAQADPPAPR